MTDIEKRARTLLADALGMSVEFLNEYGDMPNMASYDEALPAIIAALTPTEREVLSESEKDVALAQAVEFAEYVERQAKGAMVDAAKRFLSLPYAQELARRLTPPEGYVLVPVEPTEKMIRAWTQWGWAAFLSARPGVRDGSG